MTLDKFGVELEMWMGSAFQGRGRLGPVPVCRRHSEVAAVGEGLVGRITLSDSEGHFHFRLNGLLGI